MAALGPGVRGLAREYVRPLSGVRRPDTSPPAPPDATRPQSLPIQPLARPTNIGTPPATQCPSEGSPMKITQLKRLDPNTSTAPVRGTAAQDAPVTDDAARRRRRLGWYCRERRGGGTAGHFRLVGPRLVQLQPHRVGRPAPHRCRPTRTLRTRRRCPGHSGRRGKPYPLRHRCRNGQLHRPRRRHRL